MVIRFNERVADYIREKKWHDSQQLRELKQGGVELRLKLSSLAEVGRWVLSWGGDAVVVRPAELAEWVRQAARKVLRPPRPVDPLVQSTRFTGGIFQEPLIRDSFGQ